MPCLSFETVGSIIERFAHVPAAKNRQYSVRGVKHAWISPSGLSLLLETRGEVAGSVLRCHG